MTDTTTNQTPEVIANDLRAAFELALLQQLQSGEMTAAWGEVARKYLADCGAAARWQAERADLELTASNEQARQAQQVADQMRRLPFPKRPVQDALPATAVDPEPTRLEFAAG